MKKCRACKLDLPFDQFNKNAIKKDGLGDKCRPCMKAYRKEHYLRNKASLQPKLQQQRAERKAAAVEKLREYLDNHSCVDCGNSDVRVLEFDHRNSAEKEAGVSNMIAAGYLWSSILKEIEKCDVRCANCHRIRTQEQFGSFRSLWV